MDQAPTEARLPDEAAAARRRLLLLMEHSLDFVELLGGEGIIQYVSGAITALAGYNPAELVGRPYRDFIHPDDCAAAATAFAQVLELGRAGPVTLRYRRQDGTWRTVQATARDCLTEPPMHAVVVLTRDITEQVQAEASLAEANLELHRLSQQLILAHDAERHHLARELHDDVQQMVIGLKLSLEAAAQARPTKLPASLIESWLRLVRATIEHLDALTLRLRPSNLDDRGLPAALHAHVDLVRSATGKDIDLEIGQNLGRFAADIETACFRIVQEGLANAVRHSGAKHTRIDVRQVDQMLTATISDDGDGFDVAAARERANDSGSIGLFSMRERASLVEGRLDLASTPGTGTQVRAYLPVRQEAGGPLRP
jgi:PAS domain S-box-containing protein